MSENGETVSGATWSRVDDGFYVGSRGGDFLGFVDRRQPGVFRVFDGAAHPLGETDDLATAMDLVLAANVETRR